jgi:non-specific serine/threonine protein kinase
MAFGRSPLADPNARFCLAYALAGAGRSQDAVVILEPVKPTSGRDVFSQGCIILRLALQGEREETRELMSPEYLATSRRDAVYSLLLADIYAMLDERGQALDWLENAVNRGWINYPWLSQYDPFLSKLRSDPHFQKLMARVKGEWERFEP